LPAPTDKERLAALGVSTTVYSLVYPETRAVLTELWDSHPHGMYDAPWTARQDAMHQDFFATWAAWSGLPDIGRRLPHAYPTGGSSEAIRDAICLMAADPDKPRLVMLDGDYEGYPALAAAYGVEVVRLRRDRWREDLAGVTGPVEAFLSQPSSIDGDLWPELDAFMEAFPGPVNLDLCYLGCTTRPFGVDLSHDNLQRVFFSLSKVYGVYYHRVGGVWSRTEMPGLWGNRWFKNLFSLKLGTELMRRFPKDVLPARYAADQAAVAAAYPHATLVPSDVVLLATAADGEPHFTRSSGIARYCLTPGLDARLA
jgi:hypothetical protein